MSDLAQVRTIGFLVAIIGAGLVMVIAVIGYLTGMIVLAVMLTFVFILLLLVLVLVFKMVALVYFAVEKEPTLQGAEVDYGLDAVVGTGETIGSHEEGSSGAGTTGEDVG